ncbi:GNAT family N-acetyltransferase [Clostridium sp. D2Q-11]|uniref:GNAT family N-acetyltransferase n=1 Tax=Anaeromonas frigoriresistens TaxID=2683708 RepID=A0A942UZD6_9FIRM|nr:GNAT family N-acetyltransferase [Anaeromonas frigoriresistens]MBS4537257.1 GNAT family N-acetyltransferase [Anaeromonas frigoriresistens]
MKTYKEKVLCVQDINESQKQQISQLIEICNRKDKIELNLNLDKRDNIHDLLYYEGDSLVGYLTLLPSYIKKEKKAIGIVHPSYRKKGIFKKLVEEGKNICSQINVEKIIFINNSESISGLKSLKSIGAKYISSSYKMIYNDNYELSRHKEDKRLQVIKANDKDIDDLIIIGTEAFHTSIEEEKEYILSGLNNLNKSIYIVKYNRKSIGAVSITEVNKAIVISDLSVLIDYRRKGIGKYILQNVVIDLYDKGYKDISLFVEIQNKNAINIYEDSGFIISNGNDFYELNIIAK